MRSTFNTVSAIAIAFSVSAVTAPSWAFDGPDPTLPAVHGNGSIGSLDDSAVAVDVLAGGSVGLTLGYGETAPDYALTYTGSDTPFQISIDSQVDTTLNVYTPSGEWLFDDDSGEGLNAELIITTPEQGTYAIYVGTFAERAPTPAAMTITAVDAASVSGGLDFSLNAFYGSGSFNGPDDDAISLPLRAGGQIDLSELDPSVLGEFYSGHVTPQPSYELTYNVEGEPLTFAVSSNGDTVLLINGPDGEWHYSDDENGLDAALSFEEPLTGVYDVWVGSYGQEAFDATLNITQDGPLTLETLLDLDGRAAESGRLTNRRTTLNATVPAGGDLDLSSVDYFGYVTAARAYSLNNTSSNSSVTFAATSETDTILLVRAPDGEWYYDDDSGGNADPRLTIIGGGQGQYDVYIPTYNPSEGVTAELTITGVDLGDTDSTIDIREEPRYGAAEVNDRTDTPYSVDLVAGGGVELGTIGSGYVTPQPSYRVTYSGNGERPLRFDVLSDSDTVIAVHGPNGQWAYDDDSGVNLGGAVAFETPSAGVYDIYVGTYSVGSLPDAELRVSRIGMDVDSFAFLLDTSLPPSYGSTRLRSGFNDQPRTVELEAGGDVNLSDIGFSGFVAIAPDHVLDYRGGGRTLTIDVDSDADTVMVVQRPDGSWEYNDDGGDDFNAQLVFENAEAGEYKIFVGTYSDNASYPAATLSFSDE